MTKWLTAGVFITAVLCARAAGQVFTSVDDDATDRFGGVVVVEEPPLPTPAPPAGDKSADGSAADSSSPAAAAPALPSYHTVPARPVHPAWSAAVEQFARAVESGDRAGVGAIVADGAAVAPFRGDRRSIPAARLVEQVSGHVLLGFHAYHHPPTSIASDVAADVAAAAIVPEDERRPFVPSDELEANRANDIAAHWIATALAPERHQGVGVIVWWDVVTSRAAFMLVKGEPVGAKQYDIVQVLYGNPLNRDDE